jgi:hypothetical protein
MSRPSSDTNERQELKAGILKVVDQHVSILVGRFSVSAPAEVK